jgi:hypothetical protein
MLEEQGHRRSSSAPRHPQGHHRLKLTRSCAARPTRTRACSSCSTACTTCPNPTEVATRPRPRPQRGPGHAVDRPQAPRCSRSSSRTAATASSPTSASTRARSARATSSSTPRTGKKTKVGRLVRMHSDEMEDIEDACAGDIVALFGVDCASGDTFTDGSRIYSMTSMFVPDAVISLAVIKPKDSKSQHNISKALKRFTKEDPTFRASARRGVRRDDHQRHGRAAPRRLHRAHEARVPGARSIVGSRRWPTARRSPSAPTTTTPTRSRRAARASTARSRGYMEPLAEGEFEFVWTIVGGSMPRRSSSIGRREGLPLDDRQGSPHRLPGRQRRACGINDGAYHAVDSSDIAFQEAARGAFRENYAQGQAP